MILKGFARTLSDSIDTDTIIAGRYLTSQDLAFPGSKCMEAIDPTFPCRIVRATLSSRGTTSVADLHASTLYSRGRRRVGCDREELCARVFSATRSTWDCRLSLVPRESIR